MNMYFHTETKMIRVGDRDFLFLVKDKAIFELDRRMKNAMSAIGSEEMLTRGEIEACLEEIPAEERDELIQDLLNCRVFVGHKEDVNFNGAKRTQQQDSIPLKTLIFHLTDACNLKCDYCYHAEWAARPPGAGVMNEEVAFRAVDFLFKHSGELPEVVLVFFGGEPLLNFKLIPPVVSYARHQALQAGKKINFAITTNGTLLRDETIEFLHENNISITVSLDGFGEVHDRYRRFPDGRPSYEVMLPGLERLLSHSRKSPVTARVTLVEKSGRVGEILNHLLDLGFTEVGFAPVTTGHPAYQLDGSEMDTLLDEFRRLSEKFLQFARSGEFFGFSNIIDLLVSLHQGEVMNYPCGAGLGLFSVDPAGRIYLCQRFTGIDEFCMGDIFQGFDSPKLGKFRARATISNKTECRKCWVRTICTGGCYHEACVREGNHLKPNLHYCDWIRRWSEIGLEVYCRLATEYPDYLEKLCMTRGYNTQPGL